MKQVTAMAPLQASGQTRGPSGGLGKLAAGLLLVATAWAVAGPIPAMLQRLAASTKTDDCATIRSPVGGHSPLATDLQLADCGSVVHAAVRVAIAPWAIAETAHNRTIVAATPDNSTDADTGSLLAVAPAAGGTVSTVEDPVPIAIAATAPPPAAAAAPVGPTHLARPTPDSRREARNILLVIGSYRHQKDAAALVERFQPWHPRFAVVELDGRVLHRVLTGPFPMADLPALKTQAHVLGVVDAWALPAPNDLPAIALPAPPPPGGGAMAQLP